MGFYGYRKLFFDLSDPEGGYRIIFLSSVRIGKLCFANFQMHAARSPGDSENQPSMGISAKLHLQGDLPGGMKFREGEVMFDQGKCRIKLELDKLSVDLRYSGKITGEGPYSCLYSSGRRKLEWMPRIPGGLVSGYVKILEEVIEYKNIPGYCDEVRSDLLPWKVPVSKLYWGRLHHRDLAMCFTVIDYRGSQAHISRLFLFIKDELYECTGLNHHIHVSRTGDEMKIRYPEEYTISCSTGNLRVTLGSFTHRELINSDFMDFIGKYGALARRLSLWISGNPRGIKFSALANVQITGAKDDYNLREVPMIDEFVEFGGSRERK